MEIALDTFDFARRSDDTMRTSAFGVHMQCRHCVESVIYSLVNGHVEHVRVWKCCQCGFPDNRVSLWVVCSMCDGTDFQYEYVCHRPTPVQIETDDAVDDRLAFQTTPEGCIGPQGTENPLGACATGDLVSTVRQNMEPLESFLRDERLEEGASLDSRERYLSMQFMRYCGLDTGATEVGLKIEADFPTSYSIEEPNTTYPSSDDEALVTIPSEGSASTSSTLTTTCLTASTLNTKSLQDFDSGYGSQCNTFSVDQTSRKRPFECDRQTTRTVAANDDETNAPLRKKPRRRRLDSLNPGLACPFYVRNPDRCKNDSCAGPGSLGIHRLKQHLDRVHLYHSCERCGAIFYGNTAGRERLAVHQRNTQPCQLVSKLRPEIWGVSYSTFEAMRSKRGAAGKREEERWRAIYRLIFPDAEEKEMSMPYVSEESAKQRHDDRIRLPTEHQVFENVTRELLRVLPARLNAAVSSRLDDDRLTAIWNDFADNQLHDVLRATLAETCSSANALPLLESKTSKAGGCEETDDLSCFDMLDFIND